MPGATTAEPNSCSIVQVIAIALPAASMIEMWVVEPCGLRSPGDSPSSGAELGPRGSPAS